MLPKPKHLAPEYAEQFKDRSVVEAYRHRPPYPGRLFEILLDLMDYEPRAVLDVGCGTGSIARPLATCIERVDAVDFSQAMIDGGRRLPGGDQPNLNWIYGRAEDAPLNPPYTLITAGASLHWMDWEIVMPRFAELLVPEGQLAIINDITLPAPWDRRLKPIISRYSTNKDFRPYTLVRELERRRLFEQHGSQRTLPAYFAQSIDSYIGSFHARNGFSRERMGAEMAAAFDEEVSALVAEFCEDGVVELEIACEVIYGTPGRIR